MITLHKISSWLDLTYDEERVKDEKEGKNNKNKREKREEEEVIAGNLK